MRKLTSKDYEYITDGLKLREYQLDERIDERMVQPRFIMKSKMRN